MLVQHAGRNTVVCDLEKIIDNNVETLVEIGKTFKVRVLGQHKAENVEEELQRIAVKEMGVEQLLQRKVDGSAFVSQRLECGAGSFDFSHDGVGLLDLFSNLGSLQMA